MDRAALRTAIQVRGYGSDTATAQNELINTVIREIDGMYRWPWREGTDTVATVAGTPSYAEPADLLHYDTVRIERGREYYDLTYLQPTELRRRSHLDRDNGVPEFWSRYASQLWLHNRPDGIYTVTLDYTKQSVVLTADGDEPAMPETYHDVIVWGVIRELCFRERDAGGYAIANDQFETWLRRMVNELGIKQRQTASEVPRHEVWGYVTGEHGRWR